MIQDILDKYSNYGSLMMLLVGFALIFASGIFFSITYFAMDMTYTALQTTDCVIDNNLLVSSCQELFGLSIYPFLVLKEILVWFSYFFIFALVLGMFITGYRSGKSPVMIGLLITFVGGITYGGVVLSNMYRLLISNDVFRDLMINFTVYNKIMLNLPWFAFFIGIFSVMLSIVNFQKTAQNTDSSIGDF